VNATAAPIERIVEHADGALHIVERGGEDPAIVLMHGFPDDHHIYDRLAPLLAPRRVVAFDWLGYGRSSRRETGEFDRASRQQDLKAVIDLLGLQKVVLVGHDSSGPEAIEFALRSAEQVAHLVLLNTYYGRSDGLRFPEMIRVFADPELAPLADAMVEDPQQRLWLLTHSAKQFGACIRSSQMGSPRARSSPSISAATSGRTRSPRSAPGLRIWSARWMLRMSASLTRRQPRRHACPAHQPHAVRSDTGVLPGWPPGCLRLAGRRALWSRDRADRRRDGTRAYAAHAPAGFLRRGR
jgi:pimeloyl-ACP methyl ester carboxylesterase